MSVVFENSETLDEEQKDWLSWNDHFGMNQSLKYLQKVHGRCGNECFAKVQNGSCILWVLEEFRIREENIQSVFLTSKTWLEDYDETWD